MSIHKAIFLDRDGTIIPDIPYLSDEKLISIPHSSILGLKLLQHLEFKLIIVTNQSGIARGYFKESDLHRIHNHLLFLLKNDGIEITDVFYCPHHPDDGCMCRKPSGYLIQKAAFKHDIHLSQSYMIGDKETDVEAGRNAGVKSVLLSNSEESTSHNIHEYSATNLFEAAQQIQELSKILSNS
ncbi:MAG: HAD family hydrolase [Deltaproteobacteria bacterium]|nr:HAD family hydrolase [Deltaproteobacteria bacterium]